MFSQPERTEMLAGWGRFGARAARIAYFGHVSRFGTIARGAGRAYGDSAIGASLTIDMLRHNRMVSFDMQTGQLVADAGVTLAEIIDAFLPRGWFPYVTPGTKFVTLGGAIASDVHGKNHHLEGSFGAFVDWIEVIGPDQYVQRLHPQNELFAWTIGGMGLTGIITRAAIRLRPVKSAYIRQKTFPAPNLNAAMKAFERADDATYSVAWIDCLAKGDQLGRSLIMLGEHAEVSDLTSATRAAPLIAPARKKMTFPINLPTFALNSLFMRAFNGLYWKLGLRKASETIVGWDSYFYPLDAILGWNKVYGRRGCVQFQCVLPDHTAHAGLTELLDVTSQAGQGSFLAVLKRMGAQKSKVSFPMSGYTLSLDFPANQNTLALLDKLDTITLAHEGRFYLAKDARMSAQTLHTSDKRMGQFRQYRKSEKLDRAFASAQSERLNL
jgi:decaprenylphospho-beta-D-ribofuranose 2-oxidase